MQQDKPYTWVKEVSAVFVRMFSKKKIQETMVLLGVVVASASLLIWPEGAAAGVSRGLSVCAEVIVPSVFPFLVLTGFFVRAGFAAKCGRMLHGVMGKLFGLSGCCGAAVVMGSEGQGVSRLVREKSDFIVSIPMYGKVNSLNVSTAASVILCHAARMQRT